MRRRAAAVLIASFGLAIAWPSASIGSAAPVVATADMRSESSIRGVRAPIRFNLVGASWNDRKTEHVEVRTSLDGTRWGPWTELEGDDSEGPDGGSPEARKRERFSSLLWVGDARFVQNRGMPKGKLHLLNVTGNADDPGAATLAARAFGRFLGGTADFAHAAGSGPIGIITRRQWGANESIRESGPPNYAPIARYSLIHHTDTGNSYSASQSDDIIRGIYVYHVRTRGFRDIAYNFLVDKYGQIFEGRYGGMDRAVVGAHTASFNYASIGVAWLGTYMTTYPSTAMKSSTVRLLSWAFTVHRIKPRASARVITGTTTAGGSRWKPGTAVTLNTISAHRDVNYTSCNGTYAYRQLDWVRARVWNRLSPIGSFVSDGSAVWYLTARGKLRVPSLQVLDTHLPRSEVLRLTPPELNSYPVIGTMPFRDGVLVRGIRLTDPVPSPSPTVDPSSSPSPEATGSPSPEATGSPSPSPSPTAVTYLVSNGALRPFQSEADVIAMGFNPARVLDVPGDVLAKHAVGEPVDPSVYPDGVLLRARSRPEVYVLSGGKKLWVQYPVFRSRTFSGEEVVVVDDEVGAAIEDGGKLRFREGTLVRGDGDNTTVYAISEGRRRPIRSPFVFTLLGYKWENVRVVPESLLLNLHSLGWWLDGRGPQYP